MELPVHMSPPTVFLHHPLRLPKALGSYRQKMHRGGDLEPKAQWLPRELPTKQCAAGFDFTLTRVVAPLGVTDEQCTASGDLERTVWLHRDLKSK